MATERVTSECAPLRDAYRAGGVSWLQALTIAPLVVHAPEDVATAWVARARRVTLRRLTDEVEWALARHDAGAPGPFPPPPLDSRLQNETWQIGAPIPEPHVQRHVSALGAAITFVGPASIVALFRTAIAAFAAAAPTPEPTWRSCERMLRHVQETWLALPRHRDPVFERDGWRCSVPACSGRRNLHDHHVRFRSRGGDNQRTNRITVCAWHHLRALHVNLVRGWGTAPDGIRWQLGLQGSSSWALLDFLGDRYLDQDEVLADRRAHKREIAARLAAWIARDDATIASPVQRSAQREVAR